jgi:hypothetical protein
VSSVVVMVVCVRAVEATIVAGRFL